MKKIIDWTGGISFGIFTIAWFFDFFWFLRGEGWAPGGLPALWGQIAHHLPAIHGVIW